MKKKRLTIRGTKNKQYCHLYLFVLVFIVLISSCGRGIKCKYSPDGVLLEKVHVKNGRNHGEFIEYWENGGIKKKCYFKEGELHGKMEKFDSLGNIISESFFIDGVREGKMIKYYSDKSIMEIIEYKNGWKNGENFQYHQNGRVSRYALLERDEVVYYREYDTNGRETFYDRKIVVTLDSDTLALGKEYTVKIEFFGPSAKQIKIGARLADKPMTQEYIELFCISFKGPYYIAFIPSKTGDQYLTVKLNLEPKIIFNEVKPIYVIKE